MRVIVLWTLPPRMLYSGLTLMWKSGLSLQMRNLCSRGNINALITMSPNHMMKLKKYPSLKLREFYHLLVSTCVCLRKIFTAVH